MGWLESFGLNAGPCEGMAKLLVESGRILRSPVGQILCSHGVEERNRFVISSWFDMRGASCCLIFRASSTPRYATMRHLISGRDPAGDAQNDFQAAGNPRNASEALYEDTADHWAQSLLLRASKDRPRELFLECFGVDRAVVGPVLKPGCRDGIVLAHGAGLRGAP